MFGVWFSLIICIDICSYKFKSNESARNVISISFTHICSIIWSLLKMALTNKSQVISTAISSEVAVCSEYVQTEYTGSISAPSQDSGRLTVVIMGW